MSKVRIVLTFVGLGLGIFLFVNGLNGLSQSVPEYQQAEKELELAHRDLAYEYGYCVFYQQIPVDQCNMFSKNKGLPLYEQYYGDGSWTVEADPDAST